MREVLKKIRDSGAPVGLSTHNPKVIEYVEEHGWDLDYYQCCLYVQTRTAGQKESPLSCRRIGHLAFWTCTETSRDPPAFKNIGFRFAPSSRVDGVQKCDITYV